LSLQLIAPIQVRDVAARYEPTIARLAPHLLEEMRGVVDGVNQEDHLSGTAHANTNDATPGRIDLLDILALNARSEIALGQWDDGCTALAWNVGGLGDTHQDLDAERSQQKRILAQNWDWRTAVGPNLALASIRQEGKPNIWMVMEVGLSV
jgi:isopenicillin-N N-acyltransferase like protein